MPKITNNSDIPLALAVWAVDDEYDYQSDPNYFSVTSLLKPIRQIVLSRRVPPELQTADVEDYVASALGSSIHAGIEKAWKDNYKKNLKILGYSDKLIDRVKINPKPEELKPDIIPIYVEHVPGYVTWAKQNWKRPMGCTNVKTACYSHCMALH